MEQFPIFLQGVMGEGGWSNAFRVFRGTRKISTATLVNFNTLYVDNNPYVDTPYVDSGSSRLVGNAIFNVSSSWGSVDNAGNPTVDHPWL